MTDKIKIVYTGLISSGRNIFHLLDVLKTDNYYNKKIQIEIYGNLPYEIKEKFSSTKLGRIIFYFISSSASASSCALLSSLSADMILTLFSV